MQGKKVPWPQNRKAESFLTVFMIIGQTKRNMLPRDKKRIKVIGEEDK